MEDEDSKIKQLRGKQVSLSIAAPIAAGITFLMPEKWPRNDQEIIDHEELIARIELALEPWKAQVDFGKKLVKAIREPITEVVKERIRGEAEGPGLFDADSNDQRVEAAESTRPAVIEGIDFVHEDEGGKKTTMARLGKRGKRR